MWLDFVVTSIDNRSIRCFWINQILPTLLDRLFHSWKQSEYQIRVACDDENNNSSPMCFVIHN